jgi:hypothetical protein
LLNSLNNIGFILVFIASCYGCKKEDNEISKFYNTTFQGVKSIYYLNTHYESADTITIKFDSSSYSYSSSNTLDFGRGNYLLKNNSIEFIDEEVRNDLYTWEWILGGTHKFSIIGDSVILYQNDSYIQVSCRLKKISD